MVEHFRHLSVVLLLDRPLWFSHPLALKIAPMGAIPPHFVNHWSNSKRTWHFNKQTVVCTFRNMLQNPYQRFFILGILRSTSMGVARRGQGALATPEIWNLTFSYQIFSKKCRFLSFEWAKSNFTTFAPPGKNTLWLRLEISTPLEKSFRRSCQRPQTRST